MKISEIVAGIYTYVATIRAKRGNNQIAVKTIVFADGQSQARALVEKMYGDGAVIAVNRFTESQLDETVPSGTVAKPAQRILPTGYTHALAQKALLNQMKRNALHVKPTIDDLRAAQGDFESEQKRVNREYEEALKDREKWAAIRSRRT